jgi:hypothetical protein
MYPIPKLTKVDEAFPANVGWIPQMEEIPAQFHRPMNTKGGRFFLSIFGGRMDYSRMGMLPREGVDPEAAWRALVVCMTTFGIKHERKEAAFAFLVDQWFSDVRWTDQDGIEEKFEDTELDAAWLAAREQKE